MNRILLLCGVSVLAMTVAPGVVSATDYVNPVGLTIINGTATVCGFGSTICGLLAGGDGDTATNHGTIQLSNSTKWGIAKGLSGDLSSFVFFARTVELTNTGTINVSNSGDGGSAVGMGIITDGGGGDTGTIVNSGQITVSNTDGNGSAALGIVATMFGPTDKIYIDSTKTISASSVAGGIAHQLVVRGNA